MPQLRQTRHRQRRKTRLQQHHQRNRLTLRQIGEQRTIKTLRRQMRAIRIQHPRHHRRRHLRKPRHTMKPARAKTRNLVHRIGNQRRPLRKRHQTAAILRQLRAETALQNRQPLGMQHQRHTQHLGDRLPRPVIRRRADTAERQHHRPAITQTGKRRAQRIMIITEIHHLGKPQTARITRRDRRLQMRIRAAAGKNFIADNHGSERRIHRSILEKNTILRRFAPSGNPHTPKQKHTKKR